MLCTKLLRFSRRFSNENNVHMIENVTITSLERGSNIIREFAKLLTLQPGVYRMLDMKEKVLYVGKAKNLRKRVLSYTQTTKLPHRLQRMVSQVASMDFITTDSEVEALLLEANLIKKWSPPFNVLLKDDKAYAYITFSQHKIAQLCKHRGERNVKQSYFGPYASSQAIDQTLLLLQKIFQLRTCNDSDFQTRKRPCLKYHIKQCSAPCVGYVDEFQYTQGVKEAIDFLQGNIDSVQKILVKKMNFASAQENFEQAAFVRDQIKSLALTQSHQNIHLARSYDFDVIGVAQSAGKICFQFFIYRNGSNLGNLPIFVDWDDESDMEEVWSNILIQFYQKHEPPLRILLPSTIRDAKLLQKGLQRISGRPCELEFPKTGLKANLMEMAKRNAQEALERALITKSCTQEHLVQIFEIFGLPCVPKRIEVYDNSHTSGAYPLGVMIVASSEGFEKKSYRRFHIRNEQLSLGDDYGMMREVMTRRFAGNTGSLQQDPDLILIDGGQGQLKVVMEVLADLKKRNIPVIAISKGPDRNAGRETFWQEGHNPLSFPKNSPVLFYLQRLRDEAHRFAITGNRSRRESGMTTSVLDQLPGIGPKRKKALLHFFGSAKAVMRAGINDLKRVEGISEDLAEKIYNYLHEIG